jgi:transposase InsO family protein
LERYEDCGLEGLSDRTRRPFRYANQLPEQVEAVKVPACSTIHAVLDRHRLVTTRRSRTRTEGTPLSDGVAPNDLWCTDYKGEFMLGDKRYCYPLTVTDHASRYLLLCGAMESNAEKPAFTAFERLFKKRGLPRAIRSDNGVPFASPNGLFNLSKLSVWWLRLGIRIERIKPGHPQQNGRHERMHLTLKKEATRPSGANILQQQAKFDNFMEQFNNERPMRLWRCSVRSRGILLLRPPVLVSQEDQPQHLPRRPGRRCEGSRFRYLAGQLSGQLYGVRFGLYRSGGENSATP